MRLLLVSLVTHLSSAPAFTLLVFPAQFCTLPLAVGSKLTQVKELYRIKAQGDVSALMWGLAAYGCAGIPHLLFCLCPLLYV